MSLNPNSNDDLLKTLGVERDRDTYKINSTSHITLVLKNLTEEINKLRTSQSTISEQPKKSEISKNIDELRKASLDILFTEYEKQYDEFDASSESKKIDPKALEAGFKSHQEVLKDYIEYCQKEGLKPLLNSDVKKLAQCYVEAHNQGLAASKKLSRAEFEEVLISGNDEHSKKIDFDTSSNLPLNAVIIRHSNCIKKLKSPKEKIGLDNLLGFFLPKNQKDSFLSQVSSKIKPSSKPYEDNINLDKNWSTESWTAIGNGLKFNSNSLSHSSLPATLSKFYNSIHESTPFFEKHSTGVPNLHQHDWLNSVVNQSTSFVTSLSGVFAPKKPEPSTEGDKRIQEQMRPGVEKSIIDKRLTVSPNTKPNSHEEAVKDAIKASHMARNEAYQAMMKATAETRRRASSAGTPPPSAPMIRTSSAPPAPLRAPPAQIQRKNSAPPAPSKDPPKINKGLGIEFFGIGTKRHREHPDSDHPEAKHRRRVGRPEANGPSSPTASNLRTLTERPRT